LLSALDHGDKAIAIYKLIKPHLSHDLDEAEMSIKYKKTKISLVDYLDALTTPYISTNSSGDNDGGGGVSRRQRERLHRLREFHAYVSSKVLIPRCLILNQTWQHD
jgi:hypothetical protein